MKIIDETRAFFEEYEYEGAIQQLEIIEISIGNQVKKLLKSIKTSLEDDNRAKQDKYSAQFVTGRKDLNPSERETRETLYKDGIKKIQNNPNFVEKINKINHLLEV